MKYFICKHGTIFLTVHEQVSPLVDRFIDLSFVSVHSKIYTVIETRIFLSTRIFTQPILYLMINDELVFYKNG